MNSKIKVLHVIAGLGTGGAEKVIMNWYEKIDKNRYQFDFLIRTDDTYYKDRIEKLGGNVFKAHNYQKNVLKNIIDTNRIIVNGNYDVVHLHCSCLIYIIPLIIAKKRNIKKRIVHVHSTKPANFLSSIIHRFNKAIIGNYANVLLACSEKAGKFAFNEDFKVLNNAINDSFFIKQEKKYRTKYQINDSTVVVGHVGRFLEVKNHGFVINIFEEFSKINKDSILLLVGTGPLKNKYEEIIKKSEIKEKVIMIGDIDDVPNFIESVDIMLLPSFYEGISLTALESQAMKKKIIISDRIDKETILTPYAISRPLDEGAEEWANTMFNEINKNECAEVYNSFKKNGYILDDVVKQVERIYIA